MVGFARADGTGCESYLRMSPKSGGDVYLAPGNQYLFSPPVRESPSSASFGALSLTVPEGERLKLDKFEYAYREDSAISGGDDGWFSFLTGGVLAAGSVETEEEMSMSRRQLLIATGAAVGAGTLTLSDAAAAESRTVTVAEFSIESESPRFELSLTDDVANVLPADQTYPVLEDNVEIGELSPKRPTITVPPETTGTMSVLTEADMSTWQRVKSGVFGRKDEEQRFELTLAERASTLSKDDTVTITDKDAIVNAVGEGGGSTALTIGGRSIPHSSEDTDHPSGHYAVADGELVYVAGTDPPDSTRVVVETGIGRTDELKDDISRLRQ